MDLRQLLFGKSEEEDSPPEWLDCDHEWVEGNGTSMYEGWLNPSKFFPGSKQNIVRDGYTAHRYVEIEKNWETCQKCPAEREHRTLHRVREDRTTGESFEIDVDETFYLLSIPPVTEYHDEELRRGKEVYSRMAETLTDAFSQIEAL